jgi:hypothetical protein
MDSKIIAAIIIAVGFVTGVYMFTQDNQFNRCVNAKLQGEVVIGDEKMSKKIAIEMCNMQPNAYSK